MIRDYRYYSEYELFITFERLKLILFVADSAAYKFSVVITIAVLGFGILNLLQQHYGCYCMSCKLN